MTAGSATPCERRTLRSQIIEALTDLLQSRIGLLDITVNLSTRKDWNRYRPAHVEYLGCIGRMCPCRSVIGAEGKRRKIAGDCGLARQFRCARVTHRGVVVRARRIRAFQGLIKPHPLERLVG